MAFKVHIRSDFSHGLESKLLTGVCRYQKEHDVYVSQFHRFGFSGAQLLLLYFGGEPSGVPFLLKIAELRKAEKEYSATKVLASDVQDARFAASRIFEANDGKIDWGGLLYEHRGTDRPEEAKVPTALRKLIYDTKTSDNALRSIFGEVFDKLDNAHTRCRTRRVTLRTCFKPYFRKDRAAGRIRCVLGRHATARNLKFLETPIRNPLNFLSDLPNKVSIEVGPVHGDLHPDNVIIDRNNVAHLIDFAWAHKTRDVLVDYVLLETSIRFMAFPSAGAVNLLDQLKVDQELLHEAGAARIQLLNLGILRKKHYHRMAFAVGLIRDRARQLLGTRFSMKKYLLVQFILLYGLLSYPQYDLYVSTRALGLIAARLEKIGLPV